MSLNLDPRATRNWLQQNLCHPEHTNITKIWWEAGKCILFREKENIGL